MRSSTQRWLLRLHRQAGAQRATARAIADELRSAARPLLLAGGGTRGAARQVCRLAEVAGLPVVHTLMGTGAAPDHPQLIGITGFWGSPIANRLSAGEADVILAVGTRFAETDSSSWEPGVTFTIPPTRLIQIDIDPNEPGRNYPTAIAATADAQLALEAIVDAYGEPTPDRSRDWGRFARLPGAQQGQRGLLRVPVAPGFLRTSGAPSRTQSS